MAFGLVLIFLTGILWCANGIVLSYITRKSMDFISYISVQAALNMVGAWLFIGDIRLVMCGNIDRLAQLNILMLGSGFTGIIGTIFMQKAMRTGHHGIIYTIAQSAMIIPFITGVVLFSERFQLLNMIGMVLVVVSIMAFGMERTNSKQQSHGMTSNAWFYLALLSLLAIGLTQTLTTVPSYWINWSDEANLRVPLLMTGSALVLFIIAIIQKTQFTKKSILIGTSSSFFVLPSTFIFFKAMDVLAQHNKVALAYPLAVGINILSFAIYSMFMIKEKTTLMHILGIVTGFTGLMLISIY
ncbi:hypothetical protein JW960_18270 [candidate division KSB1 bacterium]|nr:hypothetical protein [candidate division KSB1 bacterium]